MTEECFGSCEKHIGKVQYVNVKDPRTGYDWGEFYYCEHAIKSDTDGGLVVTILNDEEMTRAEQIWDAFKGELIDNGVKDSEDVKQALSTAIREIVNRFQYYQCCRDQDIEDMVVDARVLYDLANELEDL